MAERTAEVRLLPAATQQLSDMLKDEQRLPGVVELYGLLREIENFGIIALSAMYDSKSIRLLEKLDGGTSVYELKLNGILAYIAIDGNRFVLVSVKPSNNNT